VRSPRGLEAAVHPTDASGETRRLWTVADLCRFLGVSKRWVHERTRREEIPCYRLGTALRFEPQEIRRWIAQYRSAPEDVGGTSR